MTLSSASKRWVILVTLLVYLGCVRHQPVLGLLTDDDLPRRY